MIKIASRIEGEIFSLFDLEQSLKPIGYTIGGNWDYEHGYFDYKIDDSHGYQFLRVPFRTKSGQLDSRGAAVEMERPFLLAHRYEGGLDDHSNIGNVSAAFNQFQEPEDPDAEFPEKYVGLGRSLVQELESLLLD
ncbi:YugN-like family protein [Peribacillus kribbensis]|uniref:YugN-like family protein n=1 Tax=Peribacillus kribbensis TaxID=356658 RepID=UPI0003F98387|nr:YugN-like family protein [Peribacillus kribbensis]